MHIMTLMWPREVVEPGTDGLAAVVGAFGHGVLDSSGRLDRPAMRQRVFAILRRDGCWRRLFIRACVNGYTSAFTDTGPYCLLAIPLLAKNIGRTAGSIACCWSTRQVGTVGAADDPRWHRRDAGAAHWRIRPVGLSGRHWRMT